MTECRGTAPGRQARRKGPRGDPRLTGQEVVEAQASIHLVPVTDELLRQLADMKTDGNTHPPPTLTVSKHVLGGVEVAVEDPLSEAWSHSLGGAELFRPFRVLTAFWQILQRDAGSCGADIVLVDVGPSLGAINRTALIATDFIVVPLGADLFSLQGLRNLGPTLRRWRDEWHRRVDNWPDPEFDLPSGAMKRTACA